MSAYDALAFSYDALTYDVDYEQNILFWQKLLTRFHVKPESVLDLACGTGSASVLLAQQGYRVLGVDCSEQMLTVAAEKAAEEVTEAAEEVTDEVLMELTSMIQQKQV